MIWILAAQVGVVCCLSVFGVQFANVTDLEMFFLFLALSFFLQRRQGGVPSRSESVPQTGGAIKGAG